MNGCFCALLVDAYLPGSGAAQRARGGERSFTFGLDLGLHFLAHVRPATRDPGPVSQAYPGAAAGLPFPRPRRGRDRLARPTRYGSVSAADAASSARRVTWAAMSLPLHRPAAVKAALGVAGGSAAGVPAFGSPPARRRSALQRHASPTRSSPRSCDRPWAPRPPPTDWPGPGPISRPGPSFVANGARLRSAADVAVRVTRCRSQAAHSRAARCLFDR
jgi:hypothetical protein